MVDRPRIGTVRRELEPRLGTARLPLEVRLEDVRDELERVGRANDAPELDRELLDDRDDVLEEDERELLFVGALATEVLKVCSSLLRLNSIGVPFRSNLTRPVLASIAVISVARSSSRRSGTGKPSPAA